MFLLFCLLLARFAALQVLDYQTYQTRSEQNRIQIQSISPPRGLISDTRGELLAGNITVYNLAVITERVDSLNSILQKLTRLVGIDQIDIQNFYTLFVYLFLSSFILGAAGIIAGLWADKFDHMATVTNFLIVPLSFLSGTFYSLERLPSYLVTLSYYNPFFHMIDGFRYSIINEMDGSINFGIFYLSIISILIWLISYYLYKSGYKIKS